MKHREGTFETLSISSWDHEEPHLGICIGRCYRLDRAPASLGQPICTSFDTSGVSAYNRTCAQGRRG